MICCCCCSTVGGTAAHAIKFMDTMDNLFQAKKLKPYTVSEPKPEAQLGPVHVVVGSTFKELVIGAKEK